jgi:citrate synthase
MEELLSEVLRFASHAKRSIEDVKKGSRSSNRDSQRFNRVTTNSNSNSDSKSNSAYIDNVDLFTGLRGKAVLWWEVSTVDVDRGLLLRNYTVNDLESSLPGSKNGCVEGLFYLLLTGNLPNTVIINDMINLFATNKHSRNSNNSSNSHSHSHSNRVNNFSHLKDTNPWRTDSDVIDVLESLPNSLPILNQFSICLQTLSSKTILSSTRYTGIGIGTGIGSRKDTWRAVLVDVIDILCCLPRLAGMILRHRQGQKVAPPHTVRGQKQHDKKKGRRYDHDHRIDSDLFDKILLSSETETETEDGNENGVNASKRTRIRTRSSNDDCSCDYQDYGIELAKHLFSCNSNVNDGDGNGNGQGEAMSMIAEFCRTYIRLHCDHGGGNASAHTSRIVSSGGASPSNAVAAAWLALDGPLHGGAASQVIKWTKQMQESFQKNNINSKSISTLTEAATSTSTSISVVPSSYFIYQYAYNEFEKGRIIPGYGHAVLHVPDPRAISLINFVKNYKYKYEHEHEHEKGIGKLNLILNKHYCVELVEKTIKEIPNAIKDCSVEKGKVVRSPYPNVDAVSGLILTSVLETAAYVIKDEDRSGSGVAKTGVSTAIYNSSNTMSNTNKNMVTNAASASNADDIIVLLFAISRSFGILSQMVLDRAIELPLERPNSIVLNEALKQTSGTNRSKL